MAEFSEIKSNGSNKIGRPPMFNSPEEMEPLIQGYFDACDEQGHPYAVPGLVLALGFAHRQTLLQYAKKDEFSFTIKRAKLRIEAQRASALVTRLSGQAVLIFDLKNNFGWKDKKKPPKATIFLLPSPFPEPPLLQIRIQNAT